MSTESFEALAGLSHSPVDDSQSPVLATPTPVRIVKGVNGNRAVWGRTISIPQLSTTVGNTFGPAGPNQAVVQTPQLDEEQPLEITLQANAGTYGPVNVTILYGQGENLYKKTVVITNNNVRRLSVTARIVTISAQMVSITANTASPVTLTATVAMNETTFMPLDWFGPLWNTQAGDLGANVLADHRLIFGAGPNPPEPCTLIAASLFLTAMPTGAGSTACCIMFFDQSAATIPTNGTGAKLCSPPFTGAYQTQQFDDSQGPVLAFDKGMFWAISSTFDTFTAPGTGGLARVDVKAGAFGG